jgi:hypothetical protein
MTLTAAERFLILAHHPEKANYVIPEQTRNAGMIGSILLDLAAEDKIKIENGVVLVRSTNTKLLLPHRVVLQRMHQSNKRKKVKTWISRFAQAPGRHHREILTALERKGIVRIDRKKFLFIPYWRTSLIKSSEREEMIRDIREIIFKGRPVKNENAILLGLIQACKMFKVVCQDKEEIRTCKMKLKEIIASNVISGSVDKVIREMQAAVVNAAVISSTAATSAH